MLPESDIISATPPSSSSPLCVTDATKFVEFVSSVALLVEQELTEDSKDEDEPVDDAEGLREPVVEVEDEEVEEGAPEK